MYLRQITLHAHAPRTAAHFAVSICSTRSQRPQKQLASLKHVFAKAQCALPLKALRFEPVVQSGV
jgi:hypothetical protein